MPPPRKQGKKNETFRAKLVRAARKQVIATILSLWNLVVRAWREIENAVESIIAQTYFYYWSWKGEIKQGIRYSSLIILIVSGASPIFEVSLGFSGEDWVAKGIEATEQSFSWTLLFLLAAGYTVFHNLEELKKPGHEYRFVKLLRRIMHHSHGAGGISTLSGAEMLNICYQAFKHSGISHVCISSKENNELVVRNGHVFPEDEWLKEYYALRLKEKEGIAGRVWDDNKIWYVPRLFWPTGNRAIRLPLCVSEFHLKTMPFPHAVKFKFEYDDEVDLEKDSTGSQLVEEDPEYGCVDMNHPFGKPTGVNLPFRAFLSVPLNTRNAKMGVLNIDFSRVDSLGKPEIEMALIFACAIAEELEATKELTGTPFPSKTPESQSATAGSPVASKSVL